MNKATEKALRESIEKWEKNAKAEAPHEYVITGSHCPLCVMFVIRKMTCEGCPVYERTGKEQCEDTPWFNAHVAKLDWEDCLGSRVVLREDARQAAMQAALEEIEFLKSLLPENQNG